IIHRQLPRHLPAILRVEAHQMVAEFRFGVRGDRHAVRKTQEEARIGETGRAVSTGTLAKIPSGHSILPGVSRFGVGEGEISIGWPGAVFGISLNREFAAVLESVVALDPGQAGVGGRLFFPNRRLKRTAKGAKLRSPTARTRIG